jgi:hypothetical protein
VGWEGNRDSDESLGAALAVIWTLTVQVPNPQCYIYPPSEYAGDAQFGCLVNVISIPEDPPYGLLNCGTKGIPLPRSRCQTDRTISQAKAY